MEVYKFSATWCAPCKKYAPTFEIVKSKNPGIKFISVDVDEDSDNLVEKFDVHKLPTTVVVVNGKITHSVIGVMSEEELTELIK